MSLSAINEIAEHFRRNRLRKTESRSPWRVTVRGEYSVSQMKLRRSKGRVSGFLKHEVAGSAIDRGRRMASNLHLKQSKHLASGVL